MQIIDSHAHLDDKRFERDVPRLLDRARQAGVEHIVTIGDRLESSRKAIALCHRNQGLSATVGIHPHHVADFDDKLLEQIAKLADDPHVVAIGEIGLDYHYDRAIADRQNVALRAQLELAVEKDLPVVVHCRDAGDDLIEALGAVENPAGGIIHCFSGDLRQARTFIDLGYLLGVGGTITFSNAGPLCEVIRQLPVEKLILETDSPYLAPQPKRGRRNEPAFIKFTAHKLAELMDLSIYDVARATRANAIEVYRLPIELEPALVYRVRDVLYLNVTNACSNNCSFCGRNDGWELLGHNLKLPAEPTAEEIIAAVDEPEKYSEAVFAGCGEPTMRMDIIKAVAPWLREQGLKVRLNTNGHGDAINERKNGDSIANELEGLVDVVSVSLNVSSKKKYLAICRPNASQFSYQAVKDFILEAKKVLPKVYATAVELPGVNLKACEKIAREELEVDFYVREYFDLA